MGAGNTSWSKKILPLSERKVLEERISLLEKETGAELVVVILKSSDSYLSAPLLIAALFTFLTSLIFSTLVTFSHEYLMILIQIPFFFFFFFLGRLPFFKRLAVSDKKKEEEFNEKALTLFFELGINTTKERVGSLLVISLFERRMRLLVDETLAKKISQEELNSFIQTLIPHFKSQKYYLGLSASLDLIEKKYREIFPQRIARDQEDQLKNTIRWFDFT